MCGTWVSRMRTYSSLLSTGLMAGLTADRWPVREPRELAENSTVQASLLPFHTFRCRPRWSLTGCLAPSSSAQHTRKRSAYKNQVLCGVLVLGRVWMGLVGEESREERLKASTLPLHTFRCRGLWSLTGYLAPQLI